LPGHRGIDTRRVWATSQIDWLPRREEWAKLTSVAVVEAIRRHVGSGVMETHRRHYNASRRSVQRPCPAGTVPQHRAIQAGGAGELAPGRATFC